VSRCRKFIEETLGGSTGKILVAFWGGKESVLEENGDEESEMEYGSLGEEG
jgi:hypothetical protein